MTFELALRATEILLALALIQHSAEHLVGSAWEKRVFGVRILACLLLLTGFAPVITLILLAGLSLLILHHFQGPYNGGSDRMSLLILWCLLGAHLAPNSLWAEAAMAYLAVQVTLSYFISGQVKIVNPEWRSGRALQDVFAFSAYPVSEDLRAFSRRSTLLLVGSWAVMGFEVLFPLALLTQPTLIAMLFITASFHVANACLFGLNRFVWAWLASYPSLIWFQARVVDGLF